MTQINAKPITLPMTIPAMAPGDKEEEDLDAVGVELSGVETSRLPVTVLLDEEVLPDGMLKKVSGTVFVNGIFSVPYISK